MKLRPAMKAALKTALHFETDTSLASILRLMPYNLLLSETQRRRAFKRTTFAGPTGNWAHHNPAVKNCRCLTCHTMRQAAD